MMRHVVIILLLFLLKVAELQYVNNVCSSVEDYFRNIRRNSNCWYDPDVGASPEQTARNHGLILEKHHVKTEDSWILTIFRIKTAAGVAGKKVIFLQHGYTIDLMEFMGNGENSIAFFLAKQGFDVWLGSFRSTDFSHHETLTRRDNEYWDFSFHECGVYDLPASLKYVSQVTGKKILYMGHSMGGTAMAIYMATRPTDVKKYVRHSIFLQSPIFMRHTFGMTSKIAVLGMMPKLKILQLLNKKVLVTSNGALRKLFLNFCLGSALGMKTCLATAKLMAGGGPHLVSPERVPLLFPLFKNAVYKIGMHYIQNILSGDFKRYDYGRTGNLRMYRSAVPPSYDLSNLSTNITFIIGTYDPFTTVKDTLELFAKYKKPNWETYEIPYNHMNFLLDNQNSNKLFLTPLLNIINKHI